MACHFSFSQYAFPAFLQRLMYWRYIHAYSKMLLFIACSVHISIIISHLLHGCTQNPLKGCARRTHAAVRASHSLHPHHNYVAMQGKQKSAHNMQFGTCKMSVVPLGDSLDSLLLHTLLVHNIPHDVLSLVDELWCANMLCYIVRSLRRTNIGHPLTLLLMCYAQWGENIFSHLFPLFVCKVEKI